VVVILGDSRVRGLVVFGVLDGLEVGAEGGVVEGRQKFGVEEFGGVLRARVDLHAEEEDPEARVLNSRFRDVNNTQTHIPLQLPRQLIKSSRMIPIPLPSPGHPEFSTVNVNVFPPLSLLIMYNSK